MRRVGIAKLLTVLSAWRFLQEWSTYSFHESPFSPFFPFSTFHTKNQFQCTSKMKIFFIPFHSIKNVQFWLPLTLVFSTFISIRKKRGKTKINGNMHVNRNCYKPLPFLRLKLSISWIYDLKIHILVQFDLIQEISTILLFLIDKFDARMCEFSHIFLTTRT